MSSNIQTRLIRSTRQNGAALLILLVIIIIATTGVLLNSLNRASVATERDRITTEALAQAKEALIGYAVSVQLPISSPSVSNTPRPGDLPCPDTDNDGLEGSIAAGTACGNASGSSGQAIRLGRLPWKTLGLPDLRDGNGERLWYAVSNNFKRGVRTTCDLPGQAGCRNSDTRGTITVFGVALNIVHDGSNPDVYTPSGAVAVIIAPGAALVRADSVTAQNRTNNAIQGAITDIQNITTNYLDRYSAAGQDNADFADGSASNGFVSGPVIDANGNAIVNDRVLVLTYQDLMPKLEKRVAGEVLKCLVDYAVGNNQRYPWATRIIDSGGGNYSDKDGTLFGRIPDQTFNETKNTSSSMSDNWPSTCEIRSPTDGWWVNWKELVFYAIADAYKPDISSSPACGTCRIVNPPSASANKRVIVIVAGKQLSGISGGQPRSSPSDKSNEANYLESPNSVGSTFSQAAPISTFNDVLVYQ